MTGLKVDSYSVRISVDASFQRFVERVVRTGFTTLGFETIPVP